MRKYLIGGMLVGAGIVLAVYGVGQGDGVRGGEVAGVSPQAVQATPVMLADARLDIAQLNRQALQLTERLERELAQSEKGDEVALGQLVLLLERLHRYRQPISASLRMRLERLIAGMKRQGASPASLQRIETLMRQRVVRMG